MRILQVASGNFFSTYGGGQVYVKNIVDEMIRQKCSLIVFSFLNNLDVIKKKDYKAIDLYEIGNIEKEGGSKLNCVIVLFFLLASKISFHIEFIFRYLSESKIMVYLID